ncbi:MAG: AAA family ATPase [Myxococcota bacterium]
MHLASPSSNERANPQRIAPPSGRDEWFAELGLDGDPFGHRRSPVLATGPLRRAVNRIGDDLTLGETHICVSGPEGIGKTSLVRALPRLLRDRPGIAGVARILDPARSWSRHRESLVEQLEPPAGVLSPATLRLGARGRSRWVVVIDDAERLEQQHVDHLQNFVLLRGEGDRPIFTFVLVANVALHHGGMGTPLERWLDPSRVLHVPMAPLSSLEVRGYLGARLRRVGWEGDLPFTPDAIVRIHELTGGIAAEVNGLARRLLASAVRSGRGEVTWDWIEESLVETPIDLDAARAPTPAPASRSRVEPVDPAPAARERSVAPDRRRARSRVGRWLAIGAAVAAIATALWSQGALSLTPAWMSGAHTSSSAPGP